MKYLLILTFVMILAVLISGCASNPPSVQTKANPNYRNDMVKWHQQHDKIGQKTAPMPADQG